MERLIRATPADLEVRGSDGRTVVGIAVPWDSPTEIRGEGSHPYSEVWKRGSFAKSISERGPERVKTFAKHARGRLPIGRALLLREDPVGLYSELRISATEAGDEVLELVRDGTLDGLSIGFSPIKDRWSSQRDMVERLEAALHEISVVDYPAFAGATITGVRDQDRRLSAANAQRRLALLERSYQ
jgi:HK97 family phage prohead protease